MRGLELQWPRTARGSGRLTHPPESLLIRWTTRSPADEGASARRNCADQLLAASPSAAKTQSPRWRGVRRKGGAGRETAACDVHFGRGAGAARATAAGAVAVAAVPQAKPHHRHAAQCRASIQLVLGSSICEGPFPEATRIAASLSCRSRCCGRAVGRWLAHNLGSLSAPRANYAPAYGSAACSRLPCCSFLTLEPILACACFSMLE